MVLPTNNHLPAGTVTGKLARLGGDILAGAGVLLAFALVFLVGGWASIGAPPQPFAPTEGLYVSGLWLQAVILALLILLSLIAPRSSRLSLAGLFDRAMRLFWWIAGLCLMLAVGLVFLLATTRTLFDLGSFPPRERWWLVPAGLSRPEAWWVETSLALFGLSLALSVPVLLRAGGHVSLDVLWTHFGPTLRRWIRHGGSLLLALPVGWLLLAKGTPFAARSWQQWEVSANFGIEYVFLVKTTVPLLGFLLLMTAAFNLRPTPHGPSGQSAGSR